MSGPFSCAGFSCCVAFLRPHLKHSSSLLATDSYSSQGCCLCGACCVRSRCPARFGGVSCIVFMCMFVCLSFCLVSVCLSVSICAQLAGCAANLQEPPPHPLRVSDVFREHEVSPPDSFVLSVFFPCVLTFVGFFCLIPCVCAPRIGVVFLLWWFIFLSSFFGFSCPLSVFSSSPFSSSILCFSSLSESEVMRFAGEFD